MGILKILAEKVGFEPTVGFTLRRISSAVHSTTLPLLRTKDFNLAIVIHLSSYSDRYQNPTPKP